MGDSDFITPRRRMQNAGNMWSIYDNVHGDGAPLILASIQITFWIDPVTMGPHIWSVIDTYALYMPREFSLSLIVLFFVCTGSTFNVFDVSNS
jgi:hypothetical protein